MDKIKYNNSIYYIKKEIDSKKDSISFLLENNNQEKIILKKILGDNFEKELYSYQRLKALNIRVPKLLEKNREESYILREYIQGEYATKYILKQVLTEDHLMELLFIAELLNSDNLNIDYSPNNFIIDKTNLIYTEYEVLPYNEELNLRNFGIFHWLDIEALKKDDLENSTSIQSKKVNKELHKELKGRRDELYLNYIIRKHKIEKK